jgi:8-oxo-dGTP diphosphatase
MRKASRVIVIKDNQLLVMHRNKFGTEYDTLPGGAVEMNETEAQCAVRETQEETGIQVNDLRLMYIEHAGDMYGDQYIFLANYVEGEPTLSPNSQEYAINQLGQNLYVPKWLPLSELANAPFLSDELQNRILDGIASGWPEQVQEFSSTRNV